jgi:1-aminocyclopropane-1-carboxylate deaminase/D-cysteine desulfhydrase-like pyridoxal-dependent ACC family enzyme
MKRFFVFAALSVVLLGGAAVCTGERATSPLAAAPKASAAAPPEASAAAPTSRPTDPTPEGRAEPEAARPKATAEPTRDLPLFRRFPALAAKLPYIALGSLPTPIEKAERLGAALGLPQLYIKRDDLSGEAYGGNKTRKLELFLADAKARGKKTVITSGAAGSNHALATAIYAKKLGLRAVLLLLPQPSTPAVRRNLLADHLAGAEMRLVGTQKQVKRITDKLLQTSAPGEDPYVIEAGGSSPLGNVGYVNAAFELADQIKAGLLPEPDRIYVAMGTMGCAVGLRLGIDAAKLKTKVIPVRASTWEASSEAKMIAMYKETVALLRALDPTFPALELRKGEGWLKEGYLGGGYGVPTPKGEAAIVQFKELTGVALEPTYTGKALAALLDDAPNMKGEVVVFWNSYNSRPIDVTGARPEDLPAPFRDYFKGKGAGVIAAGNE